LSSRSNNQRTHQGRRIRRAELYNSSIVPSPHHRIISDYLQFDVSAAHEVLPGQLAWNADDGTVDIGMDGGNVTMQLGLETYFHVKADSTINDGEVVMAIGAVGTSGKILAAPAYITSEDQGIFILGIATENIAPNGFGFVTNFGTVRGLNTTGSDVSETWSVGTILFYKAGSIGKLSKFTPTAPAPHVIMALVTDAGENGALFVRPTYGLPLGDLNGNVEFGPLEDNDFVVYKSGNSRWENESLSAVRTIMGLPSGLTWYSGSGSPEGVVTAVVGCLYSNTDDSATDTLFVKKSGISNTGWTSLG